MRWVMKQDGFSDGAAVKAAGRNGRKARGARALQVASRLPRAPALLGRAGRTAQLVPYSAPLPWEATADRIPSDVSTAWCGDAVTLRAAVAAGAPLIVAPGGPAGAALLDAVAAKLEGAAAFTRVSCPAGKTWSAHEATAAVAGERVDGEEQEVVRVLAERGRGAQHLVVAVEGADRLSPEALAFLQRLSAVRVPDAPAVQVAFAGGAGFYVLLADDRFLAIREEVRSEVGPDAEYDPNTPDVAPLTGWQRAGMAVALLAVFGLMAGPFVPWKSLPFGGRAAAPPALVAQAVAAPAPAPVVLAAAMPAPVEDPAVVRARQRREFDAILAGRGANARRLSVAERERLFRIYLARQQALVPHPGMRSVDHHI